MSKTFDLEDYLSSGVEGIVKDAVKATLKNPRQSLFMAQYALASREASLRRHKAKQNGDTIPPFLIASITGACNLHCAGCYARSNHACHDIEMTPPLSAKDWKNLFIEAKELGIAFILLAGGEPMMRRDVILAASQIPEIIFPIFTNGTLVDHDYLTLFDASRHLMPIISIEGQEMTTNQRRGQGVFEKIQEAMDAFQRRQIMFGASITLTSENLDEVMSDDFIKMLHKKGSKVIFYVEYVPVSEGSESLAPNDKERSLMAERLERLRLEYDDMIFIAFPGDEKASGGCLAAGRGFFHINAQGGAEPCPFSPYSDINVKETSLREALHSPLFKRLQEQDVLMEDHMGGCVLFERKKWVESLL